MAEVRRHPDGRLQPALAEGLRRDSFDLFRDRRRDGVAGMSPFDTELFKVNQALVCIGIRVLAPPVTVNAQRREAACTGTERMVSTCRESSTPSESQIDLPPDPGTRSVNPQDFVLSVPSSPRLPGAQSPPRWFVPGRNRRWTQTCAQITRWWPSPRQHGHDVPGLTTPPPPHACGRSVDGGGGTLATQAQMQAPTTSCARPAGETDAAARQPNGLLAGAQAGLKLRIASSGHVSCRLRIPVGRLRKPPLLDRPSIVAPLAINDDLASEATGQRRVCGTMAQREVRGSSSLRSGFSIWRADCADVGEICDKRKRILIPDHIASILQDGRTSVSSKIVLKFFIKPPISTRHDRRNEELVPSNDGNRTEYWIRRFGIGG